MSRCMGCGVDGIGTLSCCPVYAPSYVDNWNLCKVCFDTFELRRFSLEIFSRGHKGVRFLFISYALRFVLVFEGCFIKVKTWLMLRDL